MAFEDVARRMQDRGGTKTGGRLYELWHGEPAPLAPVPRPIMSEPVTPATKTRTTVIGYVVLVLGLSVCIAAGLVLVMWFGSFHRWEARGLYGLIAIGAAIVYSGTQMLDASDEVAPLPRADLHN
jgi:hypothetical protein